MRLRLTLNSNQGSDNFKQFIIRIINELMMKSINMHVNILSVCKVP